MSLRLAALRPGWWAALVLGLVQGLVLAAMLLPLRAVAQDVPDKPLSATEARRWLARIHLAAHERNYLGTLTFNTEGALSSARVAHFCEGSRLRCAR